MEGPTTRITFLGFEIDTVEEQVRLPMAKVVQLRELSGAEWKNKKRCTNCCQ